MRSTFAGLNTAVRGLYANQLSQDTVSHNLSNATNKGYSRQRVNLVSTLPQSISGQYGKLQVGNGVDSQSITRIRDVFADRQMWKETASLGYGVGTYDVMQKIEAVFKENTDTGIQSVLNKFWDSLQSLSTDASNESMRIAVRERASQLVGAINQAYTQLHGIASDVNSVVEIKVNEVNQLTSEIAALNEQISTVELGGMSHANDLRDRRDSLVDTLSKLMNVQVYENDKGQYNISSGNVSLVTGKNSINLALARDNTAPLFTEYGIETFKLVTAHNGQPAVIGAGEITGLMEARDSETYGVKAYLDELDTISEFLLKDFNAAHRAGHDLNDNAGDNFFGQAGATYTTRPANGWLTLLEVNADFYTTGGWEKIAAKLPGEGNGSGANAVLLGNCLKVDKSAVLGNTNLDTYYNGVVGTIGVQTQSVMRLIDNQEALIDQIYSWRESVAGVSEDEEMSNMIRFQKGYNASARILTTLDEMLDKLINGTGVAGR